MSFLFKVISKAYYYKFYGQELNKLKKTSFLHIFSKQLPIGKKVISYLLLGLLALLTLLGYILKKTFNWESKVFHGNCNKIKNNLLKCGFIEKH